MTCSVTEMVINLVPGNRNDVHFAGKAAKTLRGGTGVTRRGGVGGRATEKTVPWPLGGGGG